MKSYYAILGISRTATLSEIKTAYRKLAMQYHPDVNRESNAHEKFIEINEAYEILCDASKRAVYDELYDAAYAKKNNSASTGTYNSSQKAKYEQWQQDANRKAEEYSSMTLNDFKFKVLDKLVKIYDAAISTLRLLFIIGFVALIFSFFIC